MPFSFPCSKPATSQTLAKRSYGTCPPFATGKPEILHKKNLASTNFVRNGQERKFKNHYMDHNLKKKAIVSHFDEMTP